jgi:ATP-dependent Lhr-like helicase
VTPFDRLHPALRHHVVNSLGWKDLRPFQEAVIEPALAGRHLLVLAPTAGGKTEAAFFPVLSRMLAEGWRGLGVLYVCPIRALLNSLDARLSRYCTLLGRRSALWHSDVVAGDKKAILRDPPDSLLTTPESLEVMLVSQKADAAALFGGLRAVIVDEVHAFAGDDRGWHLLALLSRIERQCGREFQRIGLSATVGNSEELLEWLTASCEGPRQVCQPPQVGASAAEVRLDYVGSLHNAAVVISRLHRGEKRLTFVDSRSRAEQLARGLRSLGGMVLRSR